MGSAVLVWEAAACTLMLPPPGASQPATVTVTSKLDRDLCAAPSARERVVSPAEMPEVPDMGHLASERPDQMDQAGQPRK